MSYRRVIIVTLAIVTLGSTAWAGMFHAWRFAFSAGSPVPFWSAGVVLGGLFGFAVPLLGIILAHEAGHLWACRRTGVSADGPYFIPLLPWFVSVLGVSSLLIGTVGAFVRVTGRAKTRVGEFWIGASGPLLGLFVALWLLVVGVVLSHPGKRAPAFLPDPGLLAFLTQGRPTVLHPTAIAARYGLILTALNLIPIGPLDGWRIVRSAYGTHVLDPGPLAWRHVRIIGLAGVACLCWPFF